MKPTLPALRSEVINLLLAIPFLLAFVSCSEESKIRPERIQVRISEVQMPASADVGENVNIEVRAWAPNGCYSDIEMGLNKIKEYEFNLVATAVFSGEIVCPEVLVSKDSVLEFAPLKSGTYTFHINGTGPDSWVEILLVR